jgi:hypothetical protein
MQSDASKERKAVEIAVQSVTDRRIQIQFAADGIWQADSGDNAPSAANSCCYLTAPSARKDRTSRQDHELRERPVMASLFLLNSTCVAQRNPPKPKSAKVEVSGIA